MLADLLCGQTPVRVNFDNFAQHVLTAFRQISWDFELTIKYFLVELVSICVLKWLMATDHRIEDYT